MKLKCENPQLIYNPNLVWLFNLSGLAYFDGHYLAIQYKKIQYNFPWSEFYKYKDHVTPENIDRFYIVNQDGTTSPIYMYVPCGKCRLCRAKKVSEWETRCICESASSPYVPLFITLTYRPEDRPENMESVKSDFQKFMKRLRMYVERRTGKKGSLRFLAVSEWTPKNHFPHIHMILWNMPFISPREGDQNSFWSLVKFVQDECWQFGITRVEKCRDISGAYCLKYLKKGKDPDCWFLASRRNGIGYSFAMSLLPQMMKNPDTLTFKVPNGKSVVTKGIPAYFKRLWFPTLSVLFPNEVSKAAKEFMESAADLNYALRQLYPSAPRCSDILSMVDDVSMKYQIMHIDFDDAWPSRKFRESVHHYCRLRASSGSLIAPDERRWYLDKVPCLDPSDPSVLMPRDRWFVSSVGSDRDWIIGVPSKASLLSADAFSFRSGIIAHWHRLKASYAVLMKYQFSESDFSSRLSVTAAHQDYVRSVMDKMPEVSVDDLVSLYETDQKWIETNWMQNPLT